MNNEIWESIKDYPNYKISNYGKVFSLNKNRLLKTRDNGNGYLYVDLYCKNKSKRFYIHRLVASFFIPNLENKKEVNHIDGNKYNNCSSNLEWCTSSENNKHAWKTGLKTSTEKHKKAGRNNLKKITKEQAHKGFLKRCEIIKNKGKKLHYLESKNQFVSLYCIELHRAFLSSSRVEEKLGIKQNTILCSIERGNKTCGGYHWKIIKKKL